MVLWVGKKSILTERLLSLSRAWQPQGAPTGTWFTTQCIYLKKKKVKKFIFSFFKKKWERGTDETGSDQHLAILVSSEWRSYWQTSNNLPPFLPTSSQLQMPFLNLHLSVINSFEKSEVHSNNQSGKTLQEDHDFSTCSKFAQGSIMLRDCMWGPSINAKS